MPNHNHSAAASAVAGHSHDLFYYHYAGSISGTWYSYNFNSASHSRRASSGQYQSMLGGVQMSSSGAGSVSVTINPTGSSQAHNNMQPYIAVYMWQRKSQLTVGEMPSHTHGASANTTGEHKHGAPATGNYNGGGTGFDDGGGNNPNYTRCYTSINGNHSHTITINNTGNNQPHNNLQPYVTCYIWKRVF